MKTLMSVALLALCLSTPAMAVRLANSTDCEVGASGSVKGGLMGNNVKGGGSVGVGVTCTNTTTYGNPSGYGTVELSCQSGMYANAEGQAGANGLALCADASVGDACSATVGGGGNSKYGGGGANAGVSGGGSGAGVCGGVTFGKGKVNVNMCGNLALDVGVDVCVNGSVNYANIYNRAEPFASRAVAQAAKCAANDGAALQCTFTTGDLLANAAAPFVGRAADFFSSKGDFQAGAATKVWKDNQAAAFRTANYANAVNKYAANSLKNTAYDAAGKVTNAANQVVDTGKVVINTVGNGATNVGNQVGNGVKDTGNDIAKGGKDTGNKIKKGLGL